MPSRVRMSARYFAAASSLPGGFVVLMRTRACSHPTASFSTWVIAAGGILAADDGGACGMALPCAASEGAHDNTLTAAHTTAPSTNEHNSSSVLRAISDAPQ